MEYVLTLVAARDATVLDPATIARVREAVRGGETRILSAGEAVDLFCAAPLDMAQVHQALEGKPIDAVVTAARDRPQDRRRAILVADMDSTIVTSETLDDLAVFAGKGQEVAQITKRSMNGEMDFQEALRARVAMLKGLALEALEKTWDEVRLTPGAKELVATMRAHGAVTALVSGGFTWFTSRVAAQCGFDVHRANTLLHDDVALLGQVGEPILDRDAKLAELQALAAAHDVPLARTLTVGDGANDLAMLKAAGLGIAYHAKPIVAAQARYRIDHADLRALLFVQGYAASEFQA